MTDRDVKVQVAIKILRGVHTEPELMEAVLRVCVQLIILDDNIMTIPKLSVCIAKLVCGNNYPIQISYHFWVYVLTMMSGLRLQ